MSTGDGFDFRFQDGDNHVAYEQNILYLKKRCVPVAVNVKLNAAIVSSPDFKYVVQT